MATLSTGDIVRVDGWVMLADLDPGKYRVERKTCLRREYYKFTKPRGRKPIAAHYVESVDPWLRDAGSEDNNKIVRLATSASSEATDLWK